MVALQDFYQAAKQRLQGINETAALDARLLMCHALRLSHEDFVLQSNRILSDSELQDLGQLIAQRLQHKPVAKIIGQKEFYGLMFKTNEHTLDPRPDSEVLVDVVLDYISHSSRDTNPSPACATLSHKGRGFNSNKSPSPLVGKGWGKGVVPQENCAISILDLGTGTGCLLLALLHEAPSATGVAVDQSDAALHVAEENAQRLNLSQRVTFVQSDWFANVTGQFDVIVSNPPYIPLDHRNTLSRDVRDHDPAAALFGGADGLDAYRAIINQIRDFLMPDGFVAFEVGQGQATHVADMLKNQGFGYIGVENDLGGIARVVHGKA